MRIGGVTDGPYAFFAPSSKYDLPGDLKEKWMYWDRKNNEWMQAGHELRVKWDGIR